MAKKKEEARPIHPVRHEFVAALDRFVSASLMLKNCAEFIHAHSELPAPIKEKLGEALSQFDSAFSEN